MAGSRDLSEQHKRAFIDRARIDCEHLFEFQCPRYFGELKATEQSGVRYCGECRQDVYLVTSAEELYDRASQRQCVAVILAEEIPERASEIEHLGSPRMMMGRVVLPK